jgi:hypothetical protein
MSFLSTFCFVIAFFQTLVFAAPAAQSPDNGIGDILNLLGLGFVTQINTLITLDSLTTNLVSVDFDAKNPLILELTFDRIVTKAGVNGTVYASFDHTFKPPFVVPILGSANSGRIDNVLLVQGAIASLDIIPLGKLDLISVDAHVRTGTIKGALGIPLNITGLKQGDVPANYTITV